DAEHIVHCHLLRQGGQCCVLLIDANREHAITQDLHQQANQISVLANKQTKTLLALSQARDALELKRIEAERASNAKGEFIASMSHEFRTPISSIIGYAELLGQESPEKHHPEAIRRAAWHLLILVENLLDQARLDQGEVLVQYESISLPELFNEISGLFLLQAKSRGLELEVQTPPAVLVVLDELKLRQILINLVSNAIRYTKDGYVRLFADYRDGQLVFSVADSGAGISKEDQDRIFLPFERLSTKAGGAGLGLAISQRLVELLGGSIRLESSLGAGSCFTIKLPCVASPVVTSDFTSLSGNVLLVDDDEDLLELMEIILTDWQLDVVTAMRGDLAMSSLKEHSFQVVISDYHLPDVTGSDLLESIREYDENMAVILTSGSFNISEYSRQLNGKFDGFLTKPVSNELLWGLLDKILREGRN
ncbi:MAG: response regulator, partial [Gammaproteobacteria bacterium]|nr:response regulator [Gammaproteobacteria bacterium]